MVVLQFLIRGSDNKIGTSLVQSTSTVVEHVGAVGKRTMQLALQVSVSELVNTKDLAAEFRCHLSQAHRPWFEHGGVVGK